MAKAKKAPTINNQKVTDFFALRSGPSSSQPSSSQPQPSSSQSQEARSTPKGSGRSAKAKSIGSTQSQNKPSVRQPQSSQPRAVKTEKAPSLRRLPDPEVISISSTSDAPSHISISSTSVISIQSSAVPVDHGRPKTKPQQARRFLGTVNIDSSPAPKRRSPRLASPSKSAVKVEAIRQPFKAAGNKVPPQTQKKVQKSAAKNKKRKRAIGSDDEEVINLDDVEEVIYAVSKPPQPLVKVELVSSNLVTPAPSPVKLMSPSPRKRARLDVTDELPAVGATDDEEIIPSSQSDEQELSLSKRPRKDRKEMEESVRAWQASSQSETAHKHDGTERIAGFNGDMNMDSCLCLPDRSKTPVSADRKCDAALQDANVSSVSDRPTFDFGGFASPRLPFVHDLPSTPHRNVQLRTPNCSSPTCRRPASASAPCGALTSIRTTGVLKSPSPQAVSSASSLTKVEILARTPSPKRIATPRSSPTKHVVEVVIPVMRTPRAVNEKTKTEDIINRIKEQAYADASSSPDGDAKSFSDLRPLSDSDSELDSEPGGLLSRIRKGKESSKSSTSEDFVDGLTSPLTDIDELERHSAQRLRRRSQRHVSPTPTSSIVTRTRRVPERGPMVLTDAARAPPSKRKAANPLVKLMKEKAEDARLAPLRKSLVDFKLDLTDEDVDKDEMETDANVASGSGTRRRLRSPRVSEEGDIENVVGESDRRRLFGEDDGGAIGRILDKDRVEKGKGKGKGPMLGVPFWEMPSDIDMDVDGDKSTIPRLENAGDDSLVQLLKNYLDSEDLVGLTVVLQSGVFAMPDFPVTAGFLTWLFEIAISAYGSLADTSFTILRQICERHPFANENIFVSFAPVLKLLSMFGARRDILESLGFDVPSCSASHVKKLQQHEVLWTLSELLGTFGKCKVLDPAIVPSCVALLLAIGMDVATDLDLKLSIMRAVDMLCVTYCEKFARERGEMEMSICSKILALTTSLKPANKEYLLTFVNGASPIARRIAQWVGFAMLTGDYGVQLASEYNDGPPALSHVIALLSTGSDGEIQSGFFDLRRSSETNDEFDYVALGHHAEVLARVLMNIPQYVELELQEKEAQMRARNNESFSSVSTDGGESPAKKNAQESKLDTVYFLLNRLGNKIVDTRAAHLDRSNTKATIQRLAMRINYQRMACRGRQTGSSKPRQIDAYFGRSSAT
ncbi:hypothetical protein DFH11DRAFT_1223314 [Phellopilus nigrolimitatus]|nr:hypothetical protein DFH11DRAFT_1223314 [Phellopilus nigrolimitatus]